MAEIVKLETLYLGYSKLYQATLREADGREVKQEVEDHGRAATVLAYDPDRRVALLVRVARPPVVYRGYKGEFIEPVAGMIDGDETPDQTVRREAMEEAGLRLTELERVGHVFPSPGVSAETLDLFLAPFRPEDRVAKGGGAEGENERVRILERPLAELWAAAEAGELPDAKLLILIQALKLRRPELF